jgi:hypothetical protein
MTQIRARRSFVIGIGIVLCLATVQAVTAAPPSKAVVGVAYTKQGAASVDNNVYTTVVSMAVAAGKYQVSGSVTVSNQTGSTIDQMSCNAYGNANSLDNTIGSGNGSDLNNGQATSFPVIGVVTLTAAGTIRIECISSASTFQNVGAKLVAVTLADIVNVP